MRTFIHLYLYLIRYPMKSLLAVTRDYEHVEREVQIVGSLDGRSRYFRMHVPLTLLITYLLTYSIVQSPS